MKVRGLKKKGIVTIAEFSIHPIGSGTSVGRYVKRALDSISKVEGLEFQVTPMATILEARDISSILKAVEVSHLGTAQNGREENILDSTN